MNGSDIQNTAIHMENGALDMKSCSVCNLRNTANNVLIPSVAGKAVYIVGTLYPYTPPK